MRLALVLLAAPASAAAHGSLRTTRRAVFGGALAAIAPALPALASTRADLLGGGGGGATGKCVFGEGPGCTELAEGNELILKLQQKSRDNKEKNELELYEKTTAMLGYDDYLIASDKVMVRVDLKGKFKALTPNEYNEAKKAGRISPGDNGIDNLDIVRAEAPASVIATDSNAEVKDLLAAGKVEGVIFKAPAGMSALAVSGDRVLPISFDKAWKREEFYMQCEKRGLPNNLKDVLAGNDVLAKK